MDAAGWGATETENLHTQPDFLSLAAILYPPPVFVVVPEERQKKNCIKKNRASMGMNVGEQEIK